MPTEVELQHPMAMGNAAAARARFERLERADVGQGIPGLSWLDPALAPPSRRSFCCLIASHFVVDELVFTAHDVSRTW